VEAGGRSAFHGPAPVWTGTPPDWAEAPEAAAAAAAGGAPAVRPVRRGLRVFWLLVAPAALILLWRRKRRGSAPGRPAWRT